MNGERVSDPLSTEAERALVQRLIAGDPTASRDLAAALFERLVVRLTREFSGDAHMVHDAVTEAFLALVRNPSVYDPERMGLEDYWLMAARGDLRNLLAKERRRDGRRVVLEDVELSAAGGESRRDRDDPSRRLEIAEEAAAAMTRILGGLPDGLSEADVQAISLILQKERSPQAFAELYGIQNLPEDDMRRDVKRHKDRLKKMLERAGRMP